MSAELWGLPPEERASRYRARAEEARLMATAVSDALVQASLQKLAHDWDDLAVHTLTNGRPR